MTSQQLIDSFDTLEKRAFPNFDRRSNRRKAAVHSFYRRRRSQIRRETDDTSRVYVDTHEAKIGYLALALMGLSIVDAFFTTVLLQNGSQELNPLLAYLIELDATLFLAIKFFITGASIVFFILHKHHKLFNLINCYQLLVLSVTVYSILVGYELLMVRHILFW